MSTGNEVADLLDEIDRVALVDAANDALSGWRYIRRNHGNLYGVAWDRVENALVEALAAFPNADVPPTPKAIAVSDTPAARLKGNL